MSPSTVAKPDPTRAQAELGFVELRSGETLPIVSGGGQVSARGPAGATSSGGVIYEHDMPSLETLLAESQIVTAVLEKDRPVIGPLRIVVATMIATVVAATGWLLLIAEVSEEGVGANPYISLGMALGGLVLLMTIFVALKRP